jgi:heterodisulfide reductase subunit A
MPPREKAIALIDCGKMPIEPNTASIEETECSGCRTCVGLCPFDAISSDENNDMKSKIDEALCKGCGTCVAACPSGAARQNLFTDEQIFDEIEGILSFT